MSKTIATNLGGGEIVGGPVWKTLFLRLQEPCKRAFRAASNGRRPAGGCTKVETAWLLGWATGIKAVSLEPGNPAHAKICVNPHQKSRNKGDIRRCSGRDFGTALSLPARQCWCDPNPSHVPGTCGSVTAGTGEMEEPGGTASAG